MSGRIESLKTIEAPRHRLAPITATAPISQLSPLQKNSSDAKAAPTQANPASRPFLLAVRSATAPRIGSSIAERIVENVTRYDGRDPGATDSPSTLIRSSTAAFLATSMMYGANMTVPTVVT